MLCKESRPPIVLAKYRLEFLALLYKFVALSVSVRVVPRVLRISDYEL